MESFCPIHIDLKDRTCLVLGGGAVAGRKVKVMLAFGAAVTVVSPDLSPELSQMLEEEKIAYLADTYRPVYLKDKFLVICATGSEEINRRAAEECINRGIPVNTVSDPGMCTFYLPALHKDGPLTVSVSTAGKSPALARRLRDKIASSLDGAYPEFAEFLGQARALVLERVEDRARRRVLLEFLASDDFFTDFKRLPREGVEEKVKELIEEFGEKGDREGDGG